MRTMQEKFYCSSAFFSLLTSCRLPCLFILRCSYLSPISEILRRVLLPRHSFPSSPKQPSPTDKTRVVNSTRRKPTHLSLSTTRPPRKLRGLLEILTAIVLVSSRRRSIFSIKNFSKNVDFRNHSSFVKSGRYKV